MPNGPACFAADPSRLPGAGHRQLFGAETDRSSTTPAKRRRTTGTRQVPHTRTRQEEEKLVAPVEGRDELLFEQLRELRKDLASEAGIAPYMVFGDAALTQMAIFLPTSKAEFLDINGVGEKKLEK